MTGDRRASLGLPAVALTLFLAFLWGGNPVAIKIGLADAPPLRLGWMRFVLGGSVVLSWALARKIPLRIDATEWRPLLLVGGLFVLQLGFLNIGQDHTTSGHAVVIMTSHILWTSVLAHFFVPGDRLDGGRLLGVLLAYGGVGLVFSTSLAEPGASLLGDGLLIVSSIFLATRHIVLSHTMQAVAIPKLLISQSVMGTVSFVAGSALFETEPTRFTWQLGGALFYQGVVIAGFAFLAQGWLLKHHLPSRVSTLFLSQPLWGVFLSWWILGEAVGPALYSGAALVALGSYLVQRRRANQNP